ncbi:MAG: hypothetical protein JRH10_15010 [Deltaproteobacteria bacterium]|nr:hypothetical protein [Deltaproteobacteria bacterium]MBW2445561.1 hypothetical protein [Deltaproteobacteria bacterium]
MKRKFCWLAPLLVLVAGCAFGPSTPEEAAARSPWAFFESAPDDLWASKITDWQLRQRRDAPVLAASPDEARRLPPDWALLREKSLAFEQRERRALAKRIAKFSQDEARSHFRWDPDTNLADDPWPTSLELYAQNGDDCDGLDLIAYDLLLAFGFSEAELFRVVVRRDRDGAHHMATLWFEDPHDPWIIDATGAISRFVRRFSELPGWTPLRVFDEDEIFGVAGR